MNAPSPPSRHPAARRWPFALLAAVALSIGPLASGCTVDDESIECKECNLNLPSEEACVSGYVCQSQPGGAFCIKEGTVHQCAATSATPLTVVPLAVDPDPPGIHLLRRLGLEI